MSAALTGGDLLAAAACRWGIDLSRLRPDLCLAGSPERSVWRSVVETAQGELFVLEKIPSRVYGRKRRIAATLRKLVDQGLKQAIAYLPDIDDDPISLISQGRLHGLWQLCPYVAGIELSRPAYAMDAWRGDAAAGFLIRLGSIGSTLRLKRDAAPFSIAAYCRDLFAALESRHPDIAACYRPFMDHLEARFFPVHDSLPVAFCHGDYHPLNIIWRENDIRAVIDWEFCGAKPEAYDLANLLGCLGMEDPSSLTGPFAGRLIRRLKQAGCYAAVSWQTLPDLMLAIRFAWLSEWLRKKDRPMIRMEADYMALLLKHRAARVGCA